MNVASLAPLWQVEVSGPVSSTPVIVDGVAQVGSYDGNLYAIGLATGAPVWTYATGAGVLESNPPIPLGITGSGAVDANAVYVGDAAASLHALDRATGAAFWTRKLDDLPNASIGSSPVVVNGVIYIGGIHRQGDRLPRERRGGRPGVRRAELADLHGAGGG